MTRIFPVAALAMSVLCGSALQAQTLSLDGQTSVRRSIGSNVAVAVTGLVGAPVALALDVTPGPSILGPLTIPLGLTPSLVVNVVGVIPVGGTLTVPLPVPWAESLHAARLWFAAAVLDSSAPLGFTVSNGADLTVVVRPQLAGNPLTTYPFFQHVDAINRASSVSLGIDPRHTYVVGRTANVYVVAAKTQAQWDSNPALLDVRGAPQTVTFPAGATTIQQNTFTLDTGSLPGPSEAPASGDTRLSIPYDVVIDFGQDGQFTDGVDMIDGYTGNDAGFHVVRDLTRGGILTTPNRGPYAVTAIQYTGGTLLGQKTYYPSNIATLGQLPLVVVSHGNGHVYTWYDHIGYHLASFGFVVMSHENNTQPGSHTAATTTLTNTDWFLGNLAIIGGGVLNNRVDGDTIIWIGHSRGADGVARAYDQLFRSAFTPTNYGIGDIELVSSMAPVDFGGWAGVAPILGGTGNGSHPHDANFHLWVAQADADVHGCAVDTPTYWYGLHERATRKRQSISLYGVGHGDLHDGGGQSVADGPNLVGRAVTHDLMRGYLLALVSHHIRGDAPSREYLWRQFESFRPVSAPTGAGVSVNMTLRDDAQAGRYVIDDFQNQSFANPNVATSGASVAIGVQSYVEGRADDANSDFTDSVVDPFNGFTYDDFTQNGALRTDSFACVFSFDGAVNRQLTWDLATSSTRPNFRDYGYLSFRAAQGSRHPLTTIALGDLTFSVQLEDDAGNVGTIRIGAYGGGIEEPYQRNSTPTCGVGSGWNSEYETIRIRLTDFLNNGSPLDLARVRKLRFLFGPAHGSAQGRIALDDIELTRN